MLKQFCCSLSCCFPLQIAVYRLAMLLAIFGNTMKTQFFLCLKHDLHLYEASQFNLLLQSYVHVYRCYPAHANLFGNILPLQTSISPMGTSKEMGPVMHWEIKFAEFKLAFFHFHTLKPELAESTYQNFFWCGSAQSYYGNSVDTLDVHHQTICTNR